MHKRQIGRTDLHITPLAFGGNVFGWTADETTSFELLDAFCAAGGNFIDTADVYSRWNSGVGGESETIIGKWMKERGNRSKVIIATKVGMEMGEGKKGLSGRYIIQAVEDSLRRLQTDHIDLYQSHKDDLVTPVEDTLKAYQQLISQGKVRYIGASNFSPERLKASLLASEKYGLPRYECLQPHYNLCERKLFEAELENICLSNNLGVITYYSLAAGFLTGKYRNMGDAGQSVRGKNASKYLTPAGMNLLSTLDAIAESHHCSNAAIALAWLMARASVTAPIASATNIPQLKDLLVALKTELNVNEIRMLNEAGF